MPTTAATVWTIGHSIRPWDVFVAMLHEAGIEAVADIRRFAGSRRHPHYSGTALARELPAIGIDYVPIPELGGRRRALANSPNTAWRNAAFRGYADHMRSDEYARGFAHLLALATGKRTAVMCAEAVWWRCHRSLVADDLKSRGWEVVHLLQLGRSEVHPYTPAARIVDGRLDYCAPQAAQEKLL